MNTQIKKQTSLRIRRGVISITGTQEKDLSHLAAIFWPSIMIFSLEQAVSPGSREEIIISSQNYASWRDKYPTFSCFGRNIHFVHQAMKRRAQNRSPVENVRLGRNVEISLILQMKRFQKQKQTYLRIRRGVISIIRT